MSKQSSDPSSDQQNYSVDEMMERLRDGEREKRQQDEGELVTRPDGTQVVRLRRRKRRSKQPEAEARKRKKRSMKFMVPLVIGLLVLVGVAVVLLVAKYNSRGFQEEFETGLEEVMGSQITIERLVVTPVKVRAASVRSEWPVGGFLQGMELSGVEADLGVVGFLRGSWSGDEIVAARGVLQLGTGSSGVPLVRPPAGSIPMDYDQLRCQFLEVRFGDGKASGFLLKNTDATLRMVDDDPIQVRFRGGSLTLAGWSPLEVDNGLGQVTSGGFEIVSFRAAPKGGGGEINLTTAAPVIPGRPVQLNLEVTDFPLSHLVGTGFGSMFSGVVSSDAGSIVFGNEGVPRADLRVEFSGKEAGMMRFPFLENLRTVFGDTDYVRPEFESIRGVFRESGGSAALQGLVLESKGQMMVRGSLELSAGNALSGTLEVGIPESKVITATGRKRNEVFSDPKGEYCWVTLAIGGDADGPDDNFKILLQKSAKEVYERRDSRSGGNRFDELTRPR